MEFHCNPKSLGYDFVYVDFTKNGDYIENNAKVLEAVINKVNQEKTGNFKSSLIGFSMGGLIARWCLKDMEDRAIDHKVQKYFSYDTPHQGANIPLGMQYLFKEIEFDLPYLRWFNAGGFRDLSKANNSPAARQMLTTKAIYYGLNNATPSSQTLTDLRAAFNQRIVTKGYPQQTTNYGISFGKGNNTTSTKDAGNGVQWDNFSPGTQIFKGNMTWFLANFQTKGYAVQENGVNDYIAKYRFEGLTFRKIFGIPIFPSIVLRIRNFKYTSQYPYDDAPGGYELTQADFASSLNGWANGAASDATTFNHHGHNFVSVASALDLQNQNYASGNNWQSSNMFFNIDNFIQNPGTVTGNTLSNATLSPFTAVTTSTSNSFGANLFHNADISSANALFIIRKILNADPNFSCLNNGFCGVSPSMSGADIICTTANYQLSNFPSGINILWSSVNGRFNIINGQGTPNITVSKISGGSDILRVVISNACGTSVTLEKTVYLGDPSSITGINTDYEMIHCTVIRYKWTVVGADHATTYKWYYRNITQGQTNFPSTPFATTTNNWVGSPADGSCDQIEVKVEATNACNQTNPQIYTFTSDLCPPYEDGSCSSGMFLSASPNPSTGNVQLALIDDPNSTPSGTRVKKIEKIKVIDRMGQTRKIINGNGLDKMMISLSTLPNDIYTISVYNGSIWLSKQVIRN